MSISTMNSEIDDWNESYIRARKKINNYNAEVERFNNTGAAYYNSKAAEWNKWLEKIGKLNLAYPDPKNKPNIVRAYAKDGDWTLPINVAIDDTPTDSKLAPGDKVNNTNDIGTINIKDLYDYFPNAKLNRIKGYNQFDEPIYKADVAVMQSPGDTPTPPQQPQISVLAPPEFTVSQERELLSGQPEQVTSTGKVFDGINKTTNPFTGLLHSR